MMRRILNAPLMRFLPVLYMISAGGVGHGFVLCLGEEHVAIEPSHGDYRCNYSEQNTGSSAALVTADLQHHETCLDIVLLGGHAQPAPIKLDRTAEDLPEPPVADFSLAADASTTGVHWADPLPVQKRQIHSFSPSILGLRTIVLIL